KNLINKNTIAVVGIAGNTEYGAIDDIEGLAEICKGKNLYLHVDAAFGGFVIPFLKRQNYNVRNFDFGIEGVDSITIDPHKMGMNIIPSGMLLFRKEPKFSVNVSYLQGKHERLLGTFPAGSAAGCYACLKFLGEDGYTEIVRECMENTKYLADGLRRNNIEILNPVLNILNFNIRKEIYNKLVETGWIISKTSAGYTRIVIMPHTKKAHIKKFLKDIKELTKNEEGLTVNLFKRITKKEGISNSEIQQKFYRYAGQGYIVRTERAHFIITDKGKRAVEEILKAQTKLMDYKK
ncbi:MAG: hypothetical protein CVT89_02245, partial [Candidatus Altiarchaeales archaeon HGW-Altiarchaeales-2]